MIKLQYICSRNTAFMRRNYVTYFLPGAWLVRNEVEITS